MNRQPNKTFCAKAFSHYHIGVNGENKLCCSASSSISSDFYGEEYSRVREIDTTYYEGLLKMPLMRNPKNIQARSVIKSILERNMNASSTNL